MNGPKKKDGQTICFWFFTSKVCFVKRKILYEGEEVRLLITAEQLEESIPLILRVFKREEGYLINQKEIRSGGYFFPDRPKQQKVLVVLIEEEEQINACGKLILEGNCEIAIGARFRNAIFYEYASFVEEERLRICRKQDGKLILTPCFGEQSLPVYHNYRAICNDVVLNVGDSITFLGLSVLVLPEVLICYSFFGDLRLAERNRFLPPILPKEKMNMQLQTVEEISVSEGNFKEEELEPELPQAPQRENGQPFFLSVGPSATVVLPVLLMAFLASSNGSGGYYKATIAMTVASAVLSIFWGMMQHGYRKHTFRKQEKRRREDYRAYLQSARTYLEQCMAENRKFLLERYPHYSEFLPKSNGRIKVLRTRFGEKENCRLLRLGTGDIPSPVKLKYSRKNNGLCSDVLADEAYKLEEDYGVLENVPVGISPAEHTLIGFVGDEAYEILAQLLVQLVAGFDERTLKIIYFYHKEHPKELELAQCLRWTPHIWTTDKKNRMIAGDEKEAGELLPLMQGIFTEDGGTKEQMRYVFVVANEELIQGENQINLEKAEAGRQCILYVGKRKEEIPAWADCMLLEQQNEMVWYRDGISESRRINWDRCQVKDAEDYMRHLAAADDGERGQTGMPDRVSFLELFGCSVVEELNCKVVWRESNTARRMRVPIGKGEGGRLVFLDIHEKFHGPHGLIAGTTGAGKSELLQTYLLSLAVSFSPEDVNFFVIDYKGGGMGEALRGLPHCSGVISNLSGGQIKRALLSIKSENTRRQQMLGNRMLSHVEEYRQLYREGKCTEPMPHLLLVIDEFAELKKEEPEFMQEIISLSQVGRSLGVHLLLATQKPAGCVDDKIWSNTRFRLCLRVAEKQDSMDMLHRPDAAYLTMAGRGYLQVGNDELFVPFQTGYSKAAYEEGKECRGQSALLSMTGQRSVLNSGEKEKKPRQLESVIKYVSETSERLGYVKARELWMPELPGMWVAEHRERTTWKGICLGICDDPARQRQFPVLYQQEREGHLCLCGAPATGKSVFLQSFLWQLCEKHTPRTAQFVLAGAEAAAVRCFAGMPHCLGYMTKKKEAECFFYHLKQFFIRRKELLGGIGFAQYQRKQSKEISTLYLVIDNYAAFRQMTEDVYEEFIEKIAAEGVNYGIYLVITAAGCGSGEIPARLFEKIKTTMTLEMSDRVLYGDVLRRYRFDVLPKEGIRGRGLCRMEERILEFQMPLMESSDDYERIELAEQKGVELRKEYPDMADMYFPYLPEHGGAELLWERFMQEKNVQKQDEKRRMGQKRAWVEIPMGYVKESGMTQSLYLQQTDAFVITGAQGCGKGQVLRQLLYSIDRMGKKTALYEGGALYGDGKAYEEAEVLGIGDIKEFVQKVPFCEPQKLIIVVLSFEEELQLIGTQWYEWLAKSAVGICMGGCPGNQRILSFRDLGYEQMNRPLPYGYGYLKVKAGTDTKTIMIPIEKKE